MRHDGGVSLRSPRTRPRRPSIVVCTALVVPLWLAACATSGPEPDEVLTPDGGNGAGCAALVGRYVDSARSQSADGRWVEPVRPRGLAQVLELDPDTGASVPLEERAVEILHVVGDRYSLSLGKTTVPDAVSLWDTPARCVGSELQLQTASRYDSTDGVHVTRQKMQVTLYGDGEDGLILRRTVSERALGLLDLRRGGDGGVERYRFPRLEGRPPAR